MKLVNSTKVPVMVNAARLLNLIFYNILILSLLQQIEIVYSQDTTTTTTSRPSGVPSSIKCSELNGVPSTFPIANNLDFTVQVFVLTETCQEQVDSTLTSGLTINAKSTTVGTTYYARNQATLQVVDFWTISSPNPGALWLISQRLNETTDGNTAGNGGNTTQQEQDANSRNALIIGLCLGLGLLAILLLVVGLLFYRKRKLAKQNKDKNQLKFELVVGKEYPVLREHQGQLTDELSVVVGDHVKVHAIYDDGWLNCSLVNGDCTQGMIPANSITVETNTTMSRQSKVL